MDNFSEGSKLPSLLISARRYHENRELELYIIHPKMFYPSDMAATWLPLF